MLEILLIGLVLYLSLRLAWWVVKVAFFLGLAVVALALFFTPWVLVF